MLACVIGSIGVLLAMFIHAHNVPVNYFLLAVWTVMQALTVASIGLPDLREITHICSFQLPSMIWKSLSRPFWSP